jgi:hypothetical protein
LNASIMSSPCSLSRAASGWVPCHLLRELGEVGGGRRPHSGCWLEL